MVTAEVEDRVSRSPVVLAGLLTTALTLLGVWWLDRNTSDFHIMGWYANYVIPAGAILVGLAAGSGYGVASWRTGLKIRRSLLAVVLALQLGAYVAAEYIGYRDWATFVEAVEASSFAQYFHFKTVSFAWSSHGKVGAPLGLWGYLFVGLAVAGFLAGGALAPALLMRMAYCERCQVYMRSRQVGLLPASVKPRRIGRRDTEAKASFEAEESAAGDQAAARLRRIAELSVRRDGIALKAELAADRPATRAAARLPRRIAVNLVHCRQCLSAHLQPVLWVGQGNRQQATGLERIEAGPEIVKALREG